VFVRELPRTLWWHLLVSSYRVLAGIALALLTAVPLGIFIGRYPAADRFATPVISLVYPIPKVVLLPIIMVLLGLGDGAKIFLVTLVLFFQVLIPVRDSARHVPRALVDSVTSLGAGKWAIYRHVIWPAVLPEILTALRIASGTAIAVLFFAETIACQEGLGYYLLDAWTRYAYQEMFAGIIAMGLMGFVIYTVLEVLEYRLCAWKYL
ncbi:MAG: ABC transporter permease, partial [Firmicutes bacterium]|nr:ABC transporter permease [Bacillota bacterium]